MPKKIVDTCVACGACQGECPVDAIKEGDMFSIDPEQCIDCGACQGVCPTESIVDE
jgi:NAD-dependent dihydropyrimidine dehydrogenase PreA subunit